MTLKLLVLGPQRSGTSMIARILHKSGLDMGGPPFVSTNRHNPMGFYESLCFSVFLRTAIIFMPWNRPFLAGTPSMINVNLPYKANEKDIESMGAFLDGVFEGEGYKHTYVIALWDLFKRCIPKETVLVMMTRKRKDVLRSMAKAYPAHLPEVHQQSFDVLMTRQDEIAKEWPHILRIHFDEMMTKDGQRAIQKRFSKYFPKLRLDFGSVKSNKRRRKK